MGLELMLLVIGVSIILTNMFLAAILDFDKSECYVLGVAATLVAVFVVTYLDRAI